MAEKQNQVEQATEIVKSIPEFMQAVTEVLQTPWGWFFLAVIVFWFIINRDLSNAFNLFERGESRRLEKLESYVSNTEAADESALKVIKDLRDAHYFKVATGIYAESMLRDSLINLHNITSHKVNWTQIRRALPYINASQDMSVSIRDMDFGEKFGYIYNFLVGFMFLIFAGVMLIAFTISEPKSIMNVLFGVGGATASAMFSMFVFSQNWPYGAAKQIRRELASQVSPQENSPESVQNQV
jgi:hypothetical protein